MTSAIEINLVFAYGQTGSGKTFTMHGDCDNLGLIPRLTEQLLPLDLSICEIYNEKVNELVSSTLIKSPKEFHHINEIALRKRKTGSTKLNEVSSRSHYVLHLKKGASNVFLIDLAGSEDNKKTGNEGVRMNESCSINKSLFILGQVVQAINKNATSIPYRESKITKMLQSALGGNAVGVLIACISSDVENYSATFNTLTLHKSPHW